jgi:hypothetical protein
MQRRLAKHCAEQCWVGHTKWIVGHEILPRSWQAGLGDYASLNFALPRPLGWRVAAVAATKFERENE